MTPDISYLIPFEDRPKPPKNHDCCPTCNGTKRRTSKQCSGCRIESKRPKIEQPDDPTIKYIPLTRGQYAIVDSKHYDRLSQFKYFSLWSDGTQSFYAVRTVKDLSKKSKQSLISLHRDVLELAPEDPITVDHAFHNTLDNREFINGEPNLRLANGFEQMWNRRKFRNNTSGYTGVTRNKRSVTERWQAEITVNGKTIYLGTRATAKEAYEELWRPAALKYHGEFARPE
jgi:hypothetical protein